MKRMRRRMMPWGNLEMLEPRLLLAADVVYRVNAGGAQIPGTPSWDVDTATNPSPWVNVAAANLKTSSTSSAIQMSHSSIPNGTPMEIFQSERWDHRSNDNMQWTFPVTPGTYEVRLYFAETYSGTQSVGARVFDVAIEGTLLLDNYDVFANVGSNAGIVESFQVTSDANLNIDFFRVTQNPMIKAIEILDPTTTGSELVSSLASIDFGSVLVGETAQQSILLSHNGPGGSNNITIDPTQASISPTGAPFSFDFGQTQPIVLAPGDSALVQVTFAPDADMAETAQFAIPNTGDNGPLSIGLSGTGVNNFVISFDKSTLAGALTSRPTSLQFGPDGRLYVAQQDGLIRVMDITRNGDNDYQVTSQEVITSVQDIPNHDDDGTPNPTVEERLVTGLVVTGTPSNPVIYVGSSDPRIGGGNSGADLNLDTNSGVISRLTWTGSQWDKLDLVQGLPRSEENHTINGMQLDTSTNTLYVMAGGNTNMGATSNNFALLPEFALSAALLSVDLNAIGESTYVLPTLNDEDRPGVNDANDPWGGNQGKNQAVLVPGGPVQVYSPGFRNAYDVLITQDGRFYSVDNGPNAGWGDIPIGEGPGGNATNGINEPGVTYGDGLHLITGPGYYAGHPNPTRSNPANTFNATNPQSPVSVANPIESDYQIPGVENDAMVVYGSSTNGIAEYTPSTFGGLMQGDLIIASFDNSIKRVQLDAQGQVVSSSNLFSNVGFRPLDVTVAQSGPFIGSIWVADVALGDIYVYEPTGGPTGDPNDLDGDGYSNDDEALNGTDPNNPGDIPPDNDQDFVSDLLDDDDDNDTLLDINDPYAIDSANGAETPVGTLYTWENDAPNPGGLLQLGFTGLMSNGADDYLQQFDPNALTAGGAAGVFTVDTATTGTARGTANSQLQAFQFGVNVAGVTTPFEAVTGLGTPFAGLTPQPGQEMGFYLGTGDQDNFIQLVLSGDNGGEWQLRSEVNGVTSLDHASPFTLPAPSSVELSLSVDPIASTVTPSVSVVGGGELVGPSTVIPSSWLSSVMAVGLISTNPNGAGMPVTWDYLGTRYQGNTGASALTTIDPGGIPNNSSTFKASSFQIQNNSLNGQKITSVAIDLSTAFLPDVVYDPFGTAGDPVGKDFTPDQGLAATGQTNHTFLDPRDGGFDTLEIGFNDFDPGELFAFSIDIDPTSIQGAPQPGPGHSGSISGFELSGSTVTVMFDDGTTLTRTNFALPGSFTGSDANLESIVPATPNVELVGVAATPTTLSDPQQTLRISAPANSQVRLLHIEAELLLSTVPGGGFDIDPYETNKAVSVAEQVVNVGSTGVLDIPVTLLRSGNNGGYNYFLAAVEDGGLHSDMSAPVLVEWDPSGVSTELAGYFSPTSPSTATSSNGSVVSFDDSDVVFAQIQSDGSVNYSLYFDGSDVGLTANAEDIDAFAILPDGSLLISTTGAVNVGGLSASHQDLLRFIPTSTGNSTAGAWEMYFDGSDVGLDDEGENISGVDILDDNSLVLATKSGVTAPGVTSAGQDINRFVPSQLGDNTIGTWSLVFDGSNNQLTTNGERLDAVSANGNGSVWELSTQGGFKTTGASGKDQDVFQIAASGNRILLDALSQGIDAVDINAWHTATIPAALPPLEKNPSVWAENLQTEMTVHSVPRYGNTESHKRHVHLITTFDDKRRADEHWRQEQWHEQLFAEDHDFWIGVDDERLFNDES